MTIKTFEILLGEHLCILNILLGPRTVHYREVLLYAPLRVVNPSSENKWIYLIYTLDQLMITIGKQLLRVAYLPTECLYYMASKDSFYSSSLIIHWISVFARLPFTKQFIASNCSRSSKQLTLHQLSLSACSSGI